MRANELVTTAFTLSLGNRDWLFPVLVLLVVGLGGVWWAYRGRLSTPALKLAAGAKALGLLLLAIALLEPSRSTPRPRPGANFFVILADDSRGLRLSDRGEERSRGEKLRQMLAGEPAWQGALGDLFRVRRYAFGARLRRVRDFAELSFAGTASHLGTALAAIKDRYAQAPLAGVLLLSDGNATDSLPDLAGMPPIYTVAVGGERPQPDVALERATASETAFEDAPVQLEARIDTAGQREVPLRVELRDRGGKLLETKTLVATEDDESLSARFRTRPEKTGPVVYTLEVKGGKDEATQANNRRLLLVDRPPGPFRLLYVGGRPNWEYKFLQRAVAKDRQIELVSLIRVARREPKFVFQSRSGESSNPLFRGFGKDAVDAERYDEPVLVRMGTRDAEELRGGFPKTDAELFAYHGLLLDDIEAGFFTTDQQELIERFVTKRGAGFMMLGGQDSFKPGGYDRTPIGDILPVFLDRLQPSGRLGAARIALSREGWLEDWMRLRDNEAAERDRLEALTAFEIVSRAGALKPGATVLATLQTAKAAYPGLVVQRLGAGRTLALMIGDLWRSGLRPDPQAQTDLGRLWRQAVRFLVTDVPTPVTAELRRHPAEADLLEARVLARTAAFSPALRAKVELVLTEPDGSQRPLLPTPQPGEPGVFLAEYAPKEAGLYRLAAKAVDEDGTRLGETETGLVLDLEAEEHRSIRTESTALAEISRRTGGALLAPAELEELADRLARAPAPVSDVETEPLWHSFWLLAGLLLLLGAEWTLRRSRGLL